VSAGTISTRVPERTRSARASRTLGSVCLPLVPLTIGFLMLEWLVRTGRAEAWLVPTPSSVANSLVNHFGELWRATAETLVGAAAGFSLSAVAGVAIAILLASADWVRRMFYPFAVFLQTVPIIAVAPMLVIWIGFGMPTVIASAFIVSLFPVIAGALAGLRSTDPALLDLFTLYRAGPVARLSKLKLPFALPELFTGLRVSSGLAVVGAVVGEFISGGGIGGVIDVARTQQDVNKIFAALLIGSVLGIVLFGVVNLSARLTLRHWHASERET
jgi:NitT/TauT family transport system permease protein